MEATRRTAGIDVYLVSRPIISIDTSLEIYTHHLYKHLMTQLKRANNPINLKLLFYLNMSKLNVLKKIPYGTSTAPLIYDYILPTLLILKHVPSKHFCSDKIIIHYLHHILAGPAYLHKQILGISKKICNTTNVKLVTTIHHVPEALDPDYPLLVESRIMEFTSYVKERAHVNLVLRDARNYKLKLYALHDITSFKTALKVSDALIAVSTLTARELAPLTQYTKKTYVVPLGLTINLDQLENNNPTLQNKNSKPYTSSLGQHIKIGYIGAHSLRKATFMLLPLGMLIKKKRIPAQIEAWGSGPLTDILKFLAQKLGLQNIIRFRGKFKRKELPKILKSLDVLFMPTIKEGFGLPIIEATALRVPVIAYKNSKIPNEVKKYCILIKSLEEIPAILESLYEIKHHATALSRKVIKEFGWNASIEKLLKSYLETAFSQ
ncbi:glycosyltransferase [Stetteria hydrogenophila]